MERYNPFACGDVEQAGTRSDGRPLWRLITTEEERKIAATLYLVSNHYVGALYARSGGVVQLWALNGAGGDADQLVKAAPRLLNACMEASRWCPECGGTGVPQKKSHGDHCGYCADLRSAIAAARGEE